jgi:hypothetical protein
MIVQRQTTPHDTLPTERRYVMQIEQARNQAERYLAHNLIESRAKRPPVGAAVMTRYPEKFGSLITADDQDELREKLARKMQYRARRARAKSN